MAILSGVYRLALALWVGGIASYTFVVTPVIFRTQGRDAAGRIVGAIFPLYFRYSAVLIAVALLARFALGEAVRGGRQWSGTLLLASALALTGYHAFGLVPRIERVKQAVASFETTPADDPARREFSRLHGISMALNLVVLLEGAVLIAGYEALRR